MKPQHNLTDFSHCCLIVLYIPFGVAAQASTVDNSESQQIKLNPNASTGKFVGIMMPLTSTMVLPNDNKIYPDITHLSKTHASTWM